MKHFQPESWKTKQNRYVEKQSEAPIPEPLYNLWSISLFSPKPHDRATSFFLSTQDNVDADHLQRCMDLVYPWRVDVYIVSKTAFQIQFKGPHTWREITRYTRQAFEELIENSE